MTTSIDPSVDELLLLEENQYNKQTNFVFANIKPIGAERKIGQIANVSTSSSQQFRFPMDSRDIPEHYSNPSTKPSTIFHQTNNESESFACHPFPNPSSHYHPQQLNRIQTVSKSTSGYRTSQSNRFFIPSPLYSRIPFFTLCQQTRPVLPITTLPMFNAPFQSTRERFQVNSIGRPILRTNNYHHLHGFKVRR